MLLHSDVVKIKIVIVSIPTVLMLVFATEFWTDTLGSDRPINLSYVELLALHSRYYQVTVLVILLIAGLLFWWWLSSPLSLILVKLSKIAVVTFVTIIALLIGTAIWGTVLMNRGPYTGTTAIDVALLLRSPWWWLMNTVILAAAGWLLWRWLKRGKKQDS